MTCHRYRTVASSRGLQSRLGILVGNEVYEHEYGVKSWLSLPENQTFDAEGAVDRWLGTSGGFALCETVPRRGYRRGVLHCP